MSELPDPLDGLRRSTEQVLTALGVSSWARAEDVVPVDPEPALVLALQLFGVRSRIGMEVIDWTAAHGRLLMLGRLRRLSRDAGTRVEKEVAQLLATVSQLAPSLRWKHHGLAEPLDVELTGKTSSLPLTPSTARLRARAAFGAGIRVEILYLLAARHGRFDMPVADLVRELHASKASVYEAVAEFERAGIVIEGGGTRSTRIALRNDNDLGAAIMRIAPTTPPAPWREAVTLTASLVAATEALATETISSLAAARKHLVTAQRTSLSSLGLQSQDAPTGAPEHVRAELRRVVVELADALGHALAHGSPATHAT